MIADDLKKIYDIKQDIKNELTEKYSVEVGNEFSDYPGLIRSLKTDGVFEQYFETLEVYKANGDVINKISYKHCVFDTNNEHLFDEQFLEEINTEDCCLIMETDNPEVRWMKVRDYCITSDGLWNNESYATLTDYKTSNVVKEIDFSYFDSATSSSGLRNLVPINEECTSIIYIDFYKLSDNNRRMFSFKYLPNVKSIQHLSTTGLTSYKWLFSSFSGEDLSNLHLDMSGIKDITGMFMSSKVTKIPVLTNVEGITNLKQLFNNCNTVTDIDLTAFKDATSVTDMSYMFASCSKLKNITYPDEWSLNKLQNISYMFRDSEMEEIDLSVFKGTTSINDMNHLFYYASSVKNLDLSPFENNSGVKKLNYLLYYCTSLESVNFGKWELTVEPDTNNLFNNCKALKYITCTQNMYEILRTSNSFTNLENVTWYIV